MKARTLLAAIALLGLASSGGAALGDPVIPENDVTPLPPVGAADRARNGPAPLAIPPIDAGTADDPDRTTAPLENQSAPAPAPPR